MKLFFFLLVLFLVPLVVAIPFTPQGNIDLKNVYSIVNWSVGSCPSGVVGGLLTNGSWNCSNIGVGTITGVVAGDGLTGGGSSGSVTLDVVAGNGISVAANSVGVNLSVVQARVSSNCLEGSAIRTIASDGSVVCYDSLNQSSAALLFYGLSNPYAFINSSSVGYNKTAWDSAFGWGNHAVAGYASSAALSSVGNWSADKASYTNTSDGDLRWLGIGDQRYNDTAAIGLVDARVTAVNITATNKASPGACPSGQVVMNTTTGGVQCVLGEGIMHNMLFFNSSMDTAPPLQNGMCYFTDGTDANYNCVMDAANGVVLQLGEEMYLSKPARNDESFTINNCQPVRISGATGSHPLIKLASSMPYRQAQATIGLATQQILAGQSGRITIRGAVNDCDTGDWPEGTQLFLNATSGALTSTAPGVNETRVFVGFVLYQNNNHGIIEVFPLVVPALSDLSFVNAQGYNTVLVYNNNTGLWDSQTFNKTAWDSAYGWGNHALAGYASSAALLSVGNWSADKASYTNTSAGDLRWLGIGDQRYNDTAAINLKLDNATFYAQGTATRDPTGFRDRTTSTLSFNTSSRNFTLIGSYPVYINGVVQTRTNDSVVISNTVGTHYIYYDDFTGLKTSMTPWHFESIVQVATVYWDGTKAIVGDERHGIAMDWQTHEYLHETTGTRYFNGLAGTFNDTNLNIATGEYYDDDLEIIIGSVVNRCNVIYRNTTAIGWLANQTQYFYKNATNMYYDNGGVLTAVGANNYMAIWVFATNDKDTPISCLLGQRTDTSLGNARTNNLYESLSLGVLPVAELKILYRVIIRNDATPYEETQDLRSISNMPSGTYVATSHGVLTGLNADDHPQYLLADGTRNMSGNLLFDVGKGLNASYILNNPWTENTVNEQITGSWNFAPAANVSYTGSGIVLFDIPVFFRSNVTLTTPYAGVANTSLCISDISGTCRITLNVTGTSGNITSAYFTGALKGNADTVTNGLYTTSTWTGGDLSGTGLAPQVVDGSHVHDTANITTGTLADARIASATTWNAKAGTSATSQCAAGTHVANVTTTTSGVSVTCTADDTTTVPYQNSAGGWTNTTTNTTTTLNVGIGTTAPAQKLDINGSVKVGNGNTIYLYQPSDGGYNTLQTDSATDLNISAIASVTSNINLRAANTITFSTNSSATYPNRMTIDKNGNVGIGITSPTQKLQVNGTLLVSTTNNNKITIGNPGGLNWSLSVGTPGNWDGYLKFLGPLSTDVNDYDVAITYNREIQSRYGVVSPSFKTPVYGLGNMKMLSWDNTTLSWNGTTTIGMFHPYGLHGVDILISAPSGSVDNWNSTATLGNFRIMDTMGNELLRVTNGGKMGIGTATPTQKLDVAGSINISSTGANLYFPGGWYVSSNATERREHLPNGTVWKRVYSNGTICEGSGC